MRIVFMGTPEFARKPLAALCASHHELLAVVTGPDRQSGRGRKWQVTPCKEEADQRGIPVFTPESLKDKALHENLAALKPDLFVVVAFRILPEWLFTVPRLGSINIHGSLLPRYRGAAPINWAIINGEKETGLTSFFLKKKVDTGDIIHQVSIPIESDDTADTLFGRLSDRCGDFLLETLVRIESGQMTPLPQDDNLASPAPKLTAANTQINFDRPAERVRDFVRGLAKHPGAYTWFRGDKVKIFACAVAPECSDSDNEPGVIIKAKGHLTVACRGSAVEIVSLLPAGRKPMDGVSFINGFRPQPGEKFEWSDRTER
jgi:methionyl-tRNA formyltransferase